ncbi:hypothetical protein [Mycobacterium sp.]|uniref:hypothetical protein n=1 Tax=Mycobacterium sp. TaxID=1785 RepID=UPI0031D82344
MANVVVPYFDRNEWWRVAQAKRAQYLVFDSSTLAATDTTTVSGDESIGLITTQISTSPDTAFEVLAVGMESQVLPFTNQAESTNGINALWYGGEFELSYHQPQPPASSSTVNAVTTGTLALRNKLFTQGIMYGNGWTANGADTAGDTQVLTPNAVQLCVFFEKPVLIVGTSLFTQFKSYSSSASCNVFNRTHVLGRPVHISTSQYVELVALATGQAILQPLVVG